jgi:TPR repeat protein
MTQIAAPHAFHIRRNRKSRQFNVRAIGYVLLALSLSGTHIAIADCNASSVPTVDSRVPTTAVLRWRNSAEGYAAHTRTNQSFAPTGAESHYILNRLGIMYARGRGVPRSARLATRLFRQLAMDGYTPAMVNLGTLYERGTAGRRDHRQAYAWTRAALGLGVPKEDFDVTLFKLGMIALHLNSAQRNSAERHAFSIVENIRGRCRDSSATYEDTAPLGSTP